MIFKQGNKMKISYAELSAKASAAVRKINADNGIKLQKVMTVIGRVDSIGDAVIYFDRDYSEYRVLQFINGEYVPGADYHTNDKDDAKDTALVMANPTFKAL